MPEPMPNYDAWRLASPTRFDDEAEADPDADEDWCECGHLHESHDGKAGQCRFCTCTGFIGCDPPTLSRGAVMMSTVALLRKNSGSFPTVERVFAYDLEQGKALVMLRYSDNDRQLSEVTTGELEALDAERNFVPVDHLLLRRAAYVLRRDGKPS